MLPLEYRRDEFVISTDPARLDVDAIHAFLSERAYWALERPREVVARTIEHSLCYGLYTGEHAGERAGERQAGFARVVTDYATFAWICDVFVFEEYRGRGLGKWLIDTILEHPELRGLRRWLLATRDAHGLYSQSGFKALAAPERWMERFNLNSPAGRTA